MPLESFSDEVAPENYNQTCWDSSEKYQGVEAPLYTLFFAHILQFDFHRSLYEIAGNKEAIHRCSVYNSKAAIEKLKAMLEIRSSRPWQEALETVTGKSEMDATALLGYFPRYKNTLMSKTKVINVAGKFISLI